MNLRGKAALITGGAPGIGAAIVARDVAEGARTAVADISFDHVEETAARHRDKAFVAQTLNVDRGNWMS